MACPFILRLFFLALNLALSSAETPAQVCFFLLKVPVATQMFRQCQQSVWGQLELGLYDMTIYRTVPKS